MYSLLLNKLLYFWLQAHESTFLLTFGNGSLFSLPFQHSKSNFFWLWAQQDLFDLGFFPVNPLPSWFLPSKNSALWISAHPATFLLCFCPGSHLSSGYQSSKALIFGFWPRTPSFFCVLICKHLLLLDLRRRGPFLLPL